MVQSKKMDERAFAQLVKEFNAIGELIRTLQEEKQAVLDSFDAERDRFVKGRISEKTLLSSVQKTNKELLRIDKNIRNAIARVRKLGKKMEAFASKQAPKVFRAHLTGVKLVSSKKKAKGRAKASKKKTKKK